MFLLLNLPEDPLVLLMAETLHQLGCIKPSKQWDKLSTNW